LDYLVNNDRIAFIGATAFGDDHSCTSSASNLPSFFTGSIDGREVSYGTQMKQFDCAPIHYGNNKIGVFESGVTDSHVGLSGRIATRRDCGFFYCDGVSNSDETLHATTTTGLIAGSLYDGQDPNVLNYTDRLAKSGYARLARIYSYALGGYRLGSYGNAVDEAIYSRIKIANVSWGMEPSDFSQHDCNGDWDNDVATNHMFEIGILPITSSGNDGLVYGRCTVGVPGTALAAFTLGSHADAIPSSFGSLYDVRSGAISNFSPSSYPTANHRGLIDLTAPGCRLWGFSNASSSSYNNQMSCGTSFSTPTFTAAASVFHDFYRNRYSHWIQNPGTMFSTFLLMGDRQNSYNLKSKEGFDDRWGAGRLHMRRFTPQDMDSPWGYASQSICVRNGRTVTINLPENSLNGASFMKVAAFWYDRRNDDNGKLDDVDLYVQATTKTGAIFRRYSISNNDNREMVWFSTQEVDTKYPIQIKIVGHRVSAKKEGCGDNATKVWISRLHEDSKRDDVNGPDSSIMTE
jgi:hypothetical protein